MTVWRGFFALNPGCAHAADFAARQRFDTERRPFLEAVVMPTETSDLPDDPKARIASAAKRTRDATDAFTRQAIAKKPARSTWQRSVTRSSLRQARRFSGRNCVAT